MRFIPGKLYRLQRSITGLVVADGKLMDLKRLARWTILLFLEEKNHNWFFLEPGGKKVAIDGINFTSLKEVS